MQEELKKILKNSLKLDFLENDILNYLDFNEKDIVYVSGSLIECEKEKCSSGMGNKFSDIDIFIIRDHEFFLNSYAEYDKGFKKICFKNIGSVTLDIEIYDNIYVNTIIKILKNYNPDPNIRIYNIFGNYLDKGADIYDVNSFLNRFKNCFCIFNKNRYDFLYSQLQFNSFFEILKNSYLVELDESYDDIYGNLEKNNFEVAIYCMRIAFSKLLLAILSHEKIFCDREKWMHLKFKNLVNKTNKYNDLFDTYSALFYSNLLDESDIENKINDIICICKKTTEYILLEDLNL